MSGKRLFVGARVSVQTANAIAACAEMLQRRARDARVDLKWVAPASYHVTLRFLGWTRDEAVPAVRDALERACAGVEPFRVRAARLGAFPSLDKASVVWAGVEDAAALAALAARIETAMVAVGYRAEHRAFHAHVTIARLRETRSVRELVLPLAEQMFSDSRIDGVTLFESETKSSGPVYKELHRIGFKPAPDEPKRQTGALELGDETGADTDDGWPRGHH
jgi:2'-5' RNA ligase